ncbi:unnamed protein product [Brachionus calyciflorus]|uniref:Golgin subfamily A conserved domain-containing protein n=1 Tax=Brachionus calyciflorus TaxID=104777 RepID=A0A813Z3I8_9BILA|nr:unnamed protein product [Brachionus calyciflorus]
MMTNNQHNHHQQQQPSSPEHHQIKEEKIAAARQKLKEFKKRNNENFYTETNNNNYESGRSSPASSIHSNSNINPSSSSSSSKQFLNLTSLNETQLNYAQVKEQLQLHIQTIGILVAEKAELQSKLQQQMKKSDKKQDECDELMGRLKASRQKITDLERLIQQLNQQQEQQTSNSQVQNPVDLNNQLDSKDLIIDEFKIRLSEMNEKLSQKSHEVQKFAQLSIDLKSQLEILQLKLENTSNNNDDEEMNKLKVENTELKSQCHRLNEDLSKQKLDLTNEYQSYVERLQKQIENLVDQINRLTDEREESFEKIDTLKAQIKNLQDDLAKKIDAPKPEPIIEPKLDLLENEVKYFKQQIEILLHEQSNFSQILKDKDLEIDNLNKLLNKFELDRENFNSILEQSHNDKQTISRILKQNNELKSQLEELQNVYVKVTNENLELTTKLESKVNVITDNVEQSPSPEWDNEEVNEVVQDKKESLIDGVKQRLNDLEKENKDLNDYILLSNQKLNENVNLISDLSKRIKELESGNVNRNTNNNNDNVEYVNNMKLVEVKFKKVMDENVELKEKNQELESIIEKLQFETESIVDYITMYQMERSKLNEKYKIKDEALRSLSTQLQVNKLALIEINNYLNGFIKLFKQEQEEGEEGEDENDDDDNRLRKMEFILVQIQNLLFNLTQTSSSQLIKVDTRHQMNNNQQDNNNLSSQSTSNGNHQIHQEKMEKSVAKFRTETIICSSCYGDLFIV